MYQFSFLPMTSSFFLPAPIGMRATIQFQMQWNQETQLDFEGLGKYIITGKEKEGDIIGIPLLELNIIINIR